MGVVIAIIVWLGVAAGIARLWGIYGFLRRFLLIGAAGLLPFPTIPLILSYYVWRRHVGPVEVWAPRLRPPAGRARPRWATRGVVEYEPWNSSGGILLWMVCSLFVLSTALAMVTSAAIRSAEARRSSRQRLVALGIAEREMERLKALPFRELPADGAGAPAWQGIQGLPRGHATLTLAPARIAGMRQVTVRVEWQEPNGAPRRVELVALRGPHG